ncbi:MAG TPA: GMC family oxidoreductase [Gaiella sp.]
MTYDVAIAGGGTAGCALAARLSEDPSRTVCLVEAGPDYGAFDDGAWPEDLLDARTLAFSHAWETDREDRSQLRARVIGGCSAHNACILIRPPPEDYDAWGPGWSYPEVAPYLDRAEATFAPRTFPEDELSPWHRAFAEAAGEDTIVHTANVRGTTRWNAGFAYLDAARSRANLTILAATLVDRVLVEGGRAVGLETEGAEIRARTVVLAAGAYGSPAILLRSSVDPALPVGLGLQDHVGVGFGFASPTAIQEEAARFTDERPLFSAQVSLRARSSTCEPGLWDLFHLAALDQDAEGRFEASAATFVMRTRSRGSVRLAAADPRVPPIVDHGLLADPRDAAALEEAVIQLRSLAANAGVAELGGDEVRPGPDVSPEEHARTGARGFFHPTGTCAIGAVVDDRCRVLGVESLFVADASVMPEVPRVNTNLATAAVAERVAAQLGGAAV